MSKEQQREIALLLYRMRKWGTAHTNSIKTKELYGELYDSFCEACGGNIGVEDGVQKS